MADTDSPTAEIDSHIEMGSLAGKSSLELEGLPLFNSQPIGKKTSSVEIIPHSRLVGPGSENYSSQCVVRSIFRSIKVALFSNKLNLLVLCGPSAILVEKLTRNHGWVFFLSLLGIIPLAERLGWATEYGYLHLILKYCSCIHHVLDSLFCFHICLFLTSIQRGCIFGKKALILETQVQLFMDSKQQKQLAFFTGPTVGGLLNATFGNATEMIISLLALNNGMIRVVQQSLLGSILSNLLLVLGCALFGGGLVHFRREQVFNKPSAAMNSGLLLMAVMGLLFPAVLHYTRTELHFGKSELALSRFSSCIMLVAYVAYIFFQLTSQKNLYTPINEEESPTGGNSDDEEVPDISKWESIMWLFILTCFISVLSEYLVNAIEGASVAMNIPVAFISVILLPIVGNAAEHAGAVMFAVKDKLDISLGVAIGSSTQIAMFVIPFTVVVGWIMGLPMDLNFKLFETATLIMTVLVVAFMLQEGTSNYFKGLMLLLCYLIVAASFFVHIDDDSAQDKPDDHP